MTYLIRGRQEVGMRSISFLTYGQSGEGRYLFVVVIYLEKGQGYVITARDMDKKEERLYRR